MEVFALCDANNFYVSCERVFNAKLVSRPVIVLSNNDGCVIAHSEEAKVIGIKTGMPSFQIEQMVDAYNVQDRIDIHIDVPAVRFKELSGQVPQAEGSEEIRARVIAARERQRARLRGDGIFSNALDVAEIDSPLLPSGQRGRGHA